jgi:hypothetical protein
VTCGQGGSAARACGYDGYASCPLTTANGKAIIAEFIYGGKVNSDPAHPQSGQGALARLVD